ncbi:hypothetical protein EAH80_14810 [Mycobacterium hodleri]|uniref:Uncharacterized protein n=1 Tax=Mycolicibacterium hodleri TaxID=49897 RepID=A0A502E9G9_9MYCO|nr:hypothetical protein EAH80_14810 [Mycolicibacterium hodleri]
MGLARGFSFIVNGFGLVAHGFSFIVNGFGLIVNGFGRREAPPSSLQGLGGAAGARRRGCRGPVRCDGTRAVQAEDRCRQGTCCYENRSCATS